ncbi:Hypothetical protein, putative [Bodo saltans]|uniref:Membrane-associated protein n=1 Tax=Bodo saltans TaxID=75058 RepID=A0A0S4JD38_BODSA|nr:Hypothetical protein, putative [Bodo saltans]|eukprot:CUG88160.1 Hypothetical protein, putative [Bodo saltans]
MCAPRLWLLLAILMRSCVADEVVFASTIPGIIAADIHIDYANQWMYFVAQGCIVRAPLNSSHCASTSSTFPTTRSDSAAVTVAGVTGVASFADGVDQNAMFNIPHAVTGFHNGTTLFVVEWSGNRIRKLFHMSNGSYNVTTLAGSGTPGYLDATAGRNALFNGPIGIVIDSYNTKLYIADRGNNAIRQVDISTSSVTSLLVSTSQDKINTPTFLCLSKDDSTLYFSDSGNYRIARVSTKSNAAVSIDVISGTAGVEGIVDGQNNTAAFSEVRGIALTPDESMLFVGDSTVNAIRMVRIVDGAVITIAGNTTAGLTDVQQYLGFMTKPAPLFTKPQGLRLWLLDDGRWGVIITQDFLTVRCLCITSPLTFDPFPPSVLNESSSVQIRPIASGVYAVGLYINPYTHAMYATGRNAVMQIVNSKPVVIAGQISAAGSSDGVGSAARFNFCYGLTSDDDNILYVTELDGRVVRMINITRKRQPSER